MKRFIDWRAFVVAMIIVSLISLIANKWLGVNFWLVFTLVAIALFINGWIAYYEDKKREGFKTSLSTKVNDQSDSSQ